MKKLLVISLMVTGLLAGCSTFYTTIVSVTKVRDTVMTELGNQYRLGKISVETDAKIGAADKSFLIAAATCQKALEDYKAGKGTESNYMQAFLAVKTSVDGLIAIVSPFIAQTKTVEYTMTLQKATQL